MTDRERDVRKKKGVTLRSDFAAAVIIGLLFLLIYLRFAYDYGAP